MLKAKMPKNSKRKRVTSKSVQKKESSSASLRRFAKNTWQQHVWTLQFRGLMLVWSEPTGCCFLQKIIRRPFLAQNLVKTSSSHYRMETQLLRRKIKAHLLETKSQKGSASPTSEDCNTCREDISCKVPDAKLSSTRDLWYDKPGRTWPHSSPSKSSLHGPLWWATRMPFMLSERIQVMKKSLSLTSWQDGFGTAKCCNILHFYIPTTNPLQDLQNQNPHLACFSCALNTCTTNCKGKRHRTWQVWKSMFLNWQPKKRLAINLQVFM